MEMPWSAELCNCGCILCSAAYYVAPALIWDSYFIWCSTGCIWGELILCSATYGVASAAFWKHWHMGAIMAHGCKYGLGIFGVHCMLSRSLDLGYRCIAMAVITQVRMVSNSISWGSVGMICRENVTCRGGFGISIGRPERIGELGYTAITLGGAKA